MSLPEAVTPPPDSLRSETLSARRNRLSNSALRLRVSPGINTPKHPLGVFAPKASLLDTNIQPLHIQSWIREAQELEPQPFPEPNENRPKGAISSLLRLTWTALLFFVVFPIREVASFLWKCKKMFMLALVILGLCFFLKVGSKRHAPPAETNNSNTGDSSNQAQTESSSTHQPKVVQEIGSLALRVVNTVANAANVGTLGQPFDPLVRHLMVIDAMTVGMDQRLRHLTKEVNEKLKDAVSVGEDEVKRLVEEAISVARKQTEDELTKKLSVFVGDLVDSPSDASSPPPAASFLKEISELQLRIAQIEQLNLESRLQNKINSVGESNKDQIEKLDSKLNQVSDRLTSSLSSARDSVSKIQQDVTVLRVQTADHENRINSLERADPAATTTVVRETSPVSPSVILTEEINSKLRAFESHMSELRQRIAQLSEKAATAVSASASTTPIAAQSVEELRRVAKEELAKYVPDAAVASRIRESTGDLIDYASAGLGSKVIESSEDDLIGSLPLFSQIRSSIRSSFEPEIVIRGDSRIPGRCWCFDGPKGYITIETRDTIVPTSLTLEHISRDLVPDTTSAPRKFKVFGGADQNRVLLGEFEYQMEQKGDQSWTNAASPVQNFQIQTTKPFSTYTVAFSGNYGNPITCVYRIRVHGKLVRQ